MSLDHRALFVLQTNSRQELFEGLLLRSASYGLVHLSESLAEACNQTDSLLPHPFAEQWFHVCHP